MTVRDLIRMSLLDLQVLAAGEAIPAAESQDALSILNGLLESWNLDSLWVYAIDRSVQTLVAAQASYTVGIGGNFNIARPHRLESVLWRDNATGLEQPLMMLTDAAYQGISLKTTQSTIPIYAYYNMAYPLATLAFWPVPSVGTQAVLYAWHQVTSFALLDDTIGLPPGYERALRANLAMELAPSFSATPHDNLRGVAVESKHLLAIQNMRLEPMACDAALTSRGFFDWNTGGMR